MTATADFFNYTIVEGDDVQITWTLTDSDTGNPYTFSGVTKLWVCLKVDFSDLDDDAIVNINSIDDPTYCKYGSVDVGDGQVWAWIQDTQTAGLGEYEYVYYDIQVLADGKILTLCRGKIPFVSEVIQENI